MPNRYDKSRVLRDENGKQYLNRIVYPPIPLRDTDIFIKGVFGQNFMNLANQYYGDKTLWWVIARANNQSESVITKPGKEYRIPQNVNLILQEFNELNK